MKKNIIIIMVILLMMIGITGCGNDEGSIDTQIGTAQIWVKGMIDKDIELLDSINGSGPLGFPSYYLIDEYSSDFEGYSQNDFEFQISEQNENLVEINSNDEVIDYVIEIVYFEDAEQFGFIGISVRNIADENNESEEVAVEEEKEEKNEQIESAKVWLQAVIEQDEDTLHNMDGSSPMGWPVSRQLSEIGEEVEGFTLEDFTFEKDTETDYFVIVEEKNGGLKYKVSITYMDIYDKYCFKTLKKVEM